MHSLLHAEIVRASSPENTGEARAGRIRRSWQPPPPRGALREHAARHLARAAGRLDRETARRAIA